MNIYLNIHCEYLHEYSNNIRPGYQGNTPGMDIGQGSLTKLNLKQGWTDSDED